MKYRKNHDSFRSVSGSVHNVFSVSYRRAFLGDNHTLRVTDARVISINLNFKFGMNRKRLVNMKWKRIYEDWWGDWESRQYYINI